MSSLVDLAGGAGMGFLTGGPAGAAMGALGPLLQLLQGGGEAAPPPPGLPGGGAGMVDMNPTQTQVSPGAKSAHGRTLESSNDVTVTADMPVTESLPLPMPDQSMDQSFLSQGTVPLIEPTMGNETVYDAVAPQAPSSDGAAGGGFLSAFGEMDPLELATMGLSLGSMLFANQGPPAPRPPGLPGSSMAPMRPVFRG